jgi:hypothetical protein
MLLPEHIRGAEEAKVALVIANSDYLNAPTVSGAIDGAQAFAAKLRSVGYTVSTAYDVTNVEMQNVVTAFSSNKIRGGTAVFYFGGHGVQLSGENYLEPVDGGFANVSDVRGQAMSLSGIFEAMKNLGATRTIVFLDACRRNPFNDLKPNDWSPGLAQPQNPPSNSFISYATAPNSVAPDPTNRISPYTLQLTKRMTIPGLSLVDVLAEVRSSVIDYEGDDYTPWDTNSLTQPYYFRPPVFLRSRISYGDDDVLILVNGNEVDSWNSDGGADRQFKLEPGENNVVIKVYNARTFTGGLEGFGGHYPEGWKYVVDFYNADGKQLLHLEDSEDRPEKDGPRHGKMFTAAFATIFLDPGTANVTVRRIVPRAWIPGAPPLYAPGRGLSNQRQALRSMAIVPHF